MIDFFLISGYFQISQYDIYTIFKRFGIIRTIKRQCEYEIEIDYASIKRSAMLAFHKQKPIDCLVTWVGDNENFNELSALPNAEAPDSNSPHNILNILDDDCLRVIFKDSSLNLWDFVEIADASPSFVGLAEAIFPIKFKKPNDQLERYGYGKRLSQLESFFRHFGQHLHTIDLRKFAFQDIVVGLLQKHCSNLEELKMDYLEPETMIQLRQLLGQVQKLTIFCKDQDLRHLFPTNSLLEKLEIFSTIDQLTFPQIHFPNLVDFRANEIFLDNFAMVEPFFAHNTQIRRLHIQQCLIEFGIEYILQYLPQLEQLVLNDNDHPDTDPSEFIGIFGQLKCLQTLCIRNETIPIDAILYQIASKQISLNCLILKDIENGHHLIDTICRIKTIRFLDIGGYQCELFDTHLICLVERLTQLEEIKIISKKITLIGIQQMLRITNGIRIAAFVIDRTMGDSIQIYADECLHIANIARSANIDLNVVIHGDSDQISVSFVLYFCILANNIHEKQCAIIFFGYILGLFYFNHVQIVDCEVPSNLLALPNQ